MTCVNPLWLICLANTSITDRREKAENRGWEMSENREWLDSALRSRSLDYKFEILKPVHNVVSSFDFVSVMRLAKAFRNSYW